MTNAFRVLLVEDDHDVADVLCDIISLFGGDVEWRDRAQPALDELEHGDLTPDIVISDIRMPGKSGIDLAIELRQKRPEMPLLLITGFAEEAERIPDDVPVMFKPISPRLFEQTVKSALGLGADQLCFSR